MMSTRSWLFKLTVTQITIFHVWAVEGKYFVRQLPRLAKMTVVPEYSLRDSSVRDTTCSGFTVTSPSGEMCDRPSVRDLAKTPPFRGRYLSTTPLLNPSGDYTIGFTNLPLVVLRSSCRLVSPTGRPLFG